ncbi:Tex family protein [Desulfococcaceae bacterium HSG7]|nr:Tex family protein [Desulfococcaceae bacterium HSG7]
MNENHITKISDELRLRPEQVRATAELFAQAATVPFIARYRKEITGSLDEIQITDVRDRLNRLEELDTRREAILKSLEKNGHLTDELKDSVLTAETLAELEDIYLPYKPKRRTKAAIAREKGLEPLAELIFKQTGKNMQAEAENYIDPEKGVANVEEALAGARDIMAERINEDIIARTALRRLFNSKGTLKTTVAADMETKGAKFKDYFDWEEPIAKAPSHRILAVRRGEKEEVLNLSIAPPEQDALKMLETHFVKGQEEDSKQVQTAVTDSYKRLLSRSMETEVRLAAKERADTDAIKIFADNLRELLLAAPLGSKRVMGADPGFRTGCKIVCLDRQGQLLHHDTIYPLMTAKKDAEAISKIKSMCHRYKIEAIAVGNGTAGRETEAFINAIPLSPAIPVIMVNESGASIYSASKTARKEFPDLDLTVRGSVSIGRRLMDPLSELVKIDPKSIGVGQYQHDVDQTALKKALDDVVMSCVNGVGVDVNRASAELLAYISGFGPMLARNIVSFRNENGPFKSRQELKKVKRLGPKAFEQAAGFLRISDGENPLDASAVHPESYALVDAMAADLGCSVKAITQDAQLRRKIKISDYVTEKVGLPTLNDIMQELAKPGRDPRKKFETFAYAEGISKIEDLKAGMKLPGIVTNVTAFGAFVDIGVHQDGLVHISELADRFVKDPSEIVKVHQKVKVTVMAADQERKRISLSMKSVPGRGKSKPVRKSKPKNLQDLKKLKYQNRPFNNPLAELFRKNT